MNDLMSDYNRIRSEWGAYQKLTPMQRSHFQERMLETFRTPQEAHWWSLFFAADPLAAQRFGYQGHLLRSRMTPRLAPEELVRVYRDAQRQDWLSGTTQFQAAPLWQPFLPEDPEREDQSIGWVPPTPLIDLRERAWALRVPVLHSLPLEEWPLACIHRFTRIWCLAGGWRFPVASGAFARPLTILWESEALTFVLSLPFDQAPEPYLSAGLLTELQYHWPGLGVDPYCLVASRLLTVRPILEPRAWHLSEAPPFSFLETDTF